VASTVDARDGLATLRVVEACYRSSASGKSVAVAG
jgi:predicted dehydrogenase